MNEMNPRMKRHYPLPITQPWGAPTSLPGKFSCRDDTFLSGRSEKTSLHHETDRIRRRHPRDLHKAGSKSQRTTSKELRFLFSYLEPGWYVFPQKTNELNRVWLSPSVHPYKEPILVQSGVDSFRPQIEIYWRESSNRP